MTSKTLGKMLDEAGYAPGEKGLFAKTEGPREPPLCRNCQQLLKSHVDRKCPFEASSYDPGDAPYQWVPDFYTSEEEGIAIGNVAAIQTIKIIF